MIFVELEHPGPWPVGAQVTGNVTWDPFHPGSDRARAVLVNLRWRTEGRGDRDSAIVQFLTIPFGAGPPAQITRFPFRFTLPTDGPVTYHGYLVRVIWEVEARVDVSWAIDQRATAPIIVVPRLAAPEALRGIP